MPANPTSKISRHAAVTIDAADIQTQELNSKLKQAVAAGAKKILLQNVCGQRYIGTDINLPIEISIEGTPGNDLGSFMNGPRITVHGNAQDGCGNTMNEGEIVVHGHAGDMATDDKSEPGITAGDVINELPYAFQDIIPR